MRPVVVVVLALLGLPSYAAAQRGILERIEGLIAVGEVHEARTLLESWWGEDLDESSRVELQHALWLRGILTVDPDQAELDYTRLTVEFPGGPYSDRALLRLAHSAHARGDLARALVHVRMLLRDYPSSPTRLDAERWLGEFGGIAAAATPEPTTPARERTEGRPPMPTAEATGSYTVQTGAFASADRARRLADQIRDEGFETRVVTIPGSRWIRVRVGRFQTQAQARQLMTRLRELGFDAALASDVENERPVR